MNLCVQDWGFTLTRGGDLAVGGCRAESLADRHGTPLMVFDATGLRRRARHFRAVFTAAYPGPVTVHFALKCNSTPAVVAAVLGEGLRPEVCTVYEWELARRLGADPASILVNGPAKDPLLERVLAARGGCVVVDGPGELTHLGRLAAEAGGSVDVLLRVNPDLVPRGMNKATATGSRTGSVFGFDAASGEITWALRFLRDQRNLRFLGFHTHVGTGIRQAGEHDRALKTVVRCAAEARDLGLETSVLDVGGGFGIATSRELTTREFLAYQALGRLPGAPDPRRAATPEDFARSLAASVVSGFGRAGLPLPRLILEPGRSLVSQAGVLLVRVARLKDRRGVDPWAITDGGAGTVAFPLYYEYHEILRARDPHAASRRRYSLVGSCCHSADWLYRRKEMPELHAGDVLAVCDAGAYFTVQERGFGTPRPAVVFAEEGQARVVRRRETFDDMVARDLEGLEPLGCTSGTAAVTDESVKSPRAAAEGPILLGADDAPAVAELARTAFGDHPFYTATLGMNAAGLAAYWRTFFRFAVEDPTVRVFGLKSEGALVAAVAVADDHFPTLSPYLRFLRTLRGALGWRVMARYLRFVLAYQKFMSRRESGGGSEVRGLWLMAAPSAGGAGFGAELVARTLTIMRDEDRTRVAALVDGSDRRLHRFYRRVGFTEDRRGLVRGRTAVRMALPLREEPSC